MTLTNEKFPPFTRFFRKQAATHLYDPLSFLRRPEQTILIGLVLLSSRKRSVITSLTRRCINENEDIIFSGAITSNFKSIHIHSHDLFSRNWSASIAFNWSDERISIIRIVTNWHCVSLSFYQWIKRGALWQFNRVSSTASFGYLSVIYRKSAKLLLKIK